MTDFRIKRVYDAPAPEDGLRVLVDRLWPRGLKKAEAAIDHWAKDVAPSSELRQWFAHDPTRWDEFRRRYASELDGKRQAVEELRALARGRTVTLLFGAKDERHNHAVALKDYLEGR